MSQLPDEVYMPNILKYSTLDFHIVYDEYAEEVEEKGIENFTMYIPIYRKEEAIQEVIKKACEWLKRNGSHYIGFEQGQPCVTDELIKSLKKYMEKQA